MARIPYFDLAQAPEEYRRLLGERPPLNLYRMLPHAGPAAVGFLQLGGALLRATKCISTSGWRARRAWPTTRSRRWSSATAIPPPLTSRSGS